MTEREDLDHKLKEYLAQASLDRHNGRTLGKVMEKISDVQKEVTELKEEVAELRDALDEGKKRSDRHGREIKVLKSLVRYEGETDTGQHRLDLIQHEVERQRVEHEAERKAKAEEVVWWRRQIVTWIVAAVAVFVLNILTYVLATHRK